MGKQVARRRLMEYSSKLAVFQLKAAEPLLGYAILHLITPLYLTRSSPKLLHIYSLLAAEDVRPFASLLLTKLCPRSHNIAPHFQNGQYQHYRKMSALYINP